MLDLIPLFGGAPELNIETNIFDFDRDIYGEKIEVAFIQRIRDEVKFSSVEELIQQISRDVDFARKYFHTLGTEPLD